MYSPLKHSWLPTPDLEIDLLRANSTSVIGCGVSKPDISTNVGIKARMDMQAGIGWCSVCLVLADLY